jgi:exodeoxyribonuclease VII small subunit
MRAAVTDTKPTEEAFEHVLTRLREVVETLEQGELSLEESLTLFEEGIKLSAKASRKLESAERRVEALLQEEGATRTVAFPVGDAKEGATP